VLPVLCGGFRAQRRDPAQHETAATAAYLTMRPLSGEPMNETHETAHPNAGSSAGVAGYAALELAVWLVRTWIEAGVSYDLLRQSKMSRSSADYCVSIEHPRGPTVWRPGWASDFIVVTRAQGRACREVFSLREIYDSIRGQTATGQL